MTDLPQLLTSPDSGLAFTLAYYLIWFGIILFLVVEELSSRFGPCKHEFDYIREMTSRAADGTVSCRCHKCDQVFKADCGLNLPGQLVQLNKG